MYYTVFVRGDPVYEHFDFDSSNIAFEWDEEKDKINFIKHGIHFKTAAKVFYDPDCLIKEDTNHGMELRYDILGMVGKVLFVVCTFREENIIRLISARKATAAEKRRYENDKYEIE